MSIEQLLSQQIIVLIYTKMKNFKIVLDSESYFPGSIVSGKVIIKLDVPKKYKLIEVGITGKAETFWSETSESFRDSKSTSYFENVEEYLNKWVSVWKREDSPNGVLSSGVHSYPFQFTLPHNIPSSYEGGCAWIRYGVHGRIRTGCLKFDHSTDLAFPVKQLISIDDANLLRPKQFEKKKNASLFFTPGPIPFNFELSRTGFCLGEQIPLSVNITNGSLRNAKVLASLVRREVFLASDGHARVILDKIVDVTSDKIRPWQSTIWMSNVSVPENLILTMRTCTCISVEYYLEVKLKVPWTKSTSITVPIVIGNSVDHRFIQGHRTAC